MSLWSWRSRVTPAAWRAFAAAYLGWMLDGFDFTMLTFVLTDIAGTFTINSALAGALGTVTLLSRLLGGIGAGAASDRWGRKWPLAASIFWYAGFAFLSGFSPTYGALFGLRALFGIGMGGVWTAGMPLAIEHWPQDLRGKVSGMLQSGFSAGFILAAVAVHYGGPLIPDPTLRWRVMLWLGLLPVLLGLWVWRRVDESPIWLARQRERAHEAPRPGLSRLFARDLIGTTLHTSLVTAAFLCLYYAITFWYPTLLGHLGRPPLGFLVMLNLGTILGNVIWGHVSETRAGRRGAATMAGLGAVASMPFFVLASSTPALLFGAVMIGVWGAGSFGLVPGYLNERFPTDSRALGAGFTYHVGAACSSVMPLAIGALVDRGFGLASAMGLGIAASGLASAATIWLGPETRGRALQ